jgi:thiol-disulfide isomerase/thioredoxin
MTDSETPQQPVLPVAAPAASRRRTFVLAGAAAGLAGSGLAWWRGQQTEVPQSVKEPVDGFWMQQWERPEGGVVRMQALRGRPLLINFWATWCPPCVEELPLINAFYDQNKAKGWQVLGLAVDKASAVQSFMAKMPCIFRWGWRACLAPSWVETWVTWPADCRLRWYSGQMGLWFSERWARSVRRIWRPGLV